VTTRCLLGIDQLAVDGDLEDAAARRDDDEILYVVLELLQQPLRQTDGSRCVASLGAVLDRDLHDRSLRASRLPEPPLCRTLEPGNRPQEG